MTLLYNQSMKKRMAPHQGPQETKKVEKMKGARWEDGLFEGGTLKKAPLEWECMNCTFHHVDFSGLSQEGVAWSDCVFTHCDFSRSSFARSSFRRVIFDHCRLTGCDFSASSFQDVLWQDTTGQYVNLGFSSLKQIEIRACPWRNASFTETKFLDCLMEDSDFSEAEFFHASCSGLDLSADTIDGIVLSGEELKGLVVNSYQALGLCSILGLIIKE